jgi:hypothetical protein
MTNTEKLTLKLQTKLAVRSWGWGAGEAAVGGRIHPASHTLLILRLQCYTSDALRWQTLDGRYVTFRKDEFL